MWMQELIVWFGILMSDGVSRHRLQLTLVGLHLTWVIIRANHALHMRLAAIASGVLIFWGSFALIGLLVAGWFRTWLAMPFSMPLSFSAAVTLLISAMPLLIGAPMLIFIKHYPPQKWMSSRIDRLSRPL